VHYLGEALAGREALCAQVPNKPKPPVQAAGWGRVTPEKREQTIKWVKSYAETACLAALVLLALKRDVETVKTYCMPIYAGFDGFTIDSAVTSLVDACPGYSFIPLGACRLKISDGQYVWENALSPFFASFTPSDPAMGNTFVTTLNKVHEDWVNSVLQCSEDGSTPR
jgi:hypothetical protein